MKRELTFPSPRDLELCESCPYSTTSVVVWYDMDGTRSNTTKYYSALETCKWTVPTNLNGQRSFEETWCQYCQYYDPLGKVGCDSLTQCRVVPDAFRVRDEE